MSKIVASAEVERPAAEVSVYATDPARFSEWQKGVMDGHMEGAAGDTGSPAVGTLCRTTRRIHGASRPVTSELVHIDLPRTWGVRGTDGPDPGGRRPYGRAGDGEGDGRAGLADEGGGAGGAAAIPVRFAASPFRVAAPLTAQPVVAGEDGAMDGRAARALAGDGVGRWFAGAQRGDPAAVDGLLRAVLAVLPTAQRFAARSCASREDAEDAVQEALLALVRRVGALRAAEAVTSWLFVTIRHACLRRAPGVVLVPIDVVGDLPGADLAGGVGGVVDRMTVAAALAALPAAQREVIVLVDLLDLPVDRAARQLGIGVRAAKSRLHRAWRALAALLGQPELRRSA